MRPVEQSRIGGEHHVLGRYRRVDDDVRQLGWLDVCVAVLDGALETLFRKRFPDFRAANDPISIATAA